MNTVSLATRDEFLTSILNLLEDREERLLAWGLVDGFFSYDEMCDLIDPLIDRAISDGFDCFLSADDVLDELLQRKLIALVPRPDGGKAYRSRMTETVRLMQRLRQLFPKHAGDNNWQHAPSLVADFRFIRRKRRYPVRDISIDDAIARVSKETKSPAPIVALRALLCPPGKTVLLSGFQVRALQRILRAIEDGESLATIVCAGTGSGKTLAFYLPALASIYRHLSLEDGSDRWVKVVALYPRTELLKDQLREVLQRVRSLQMGLSEGNQVTIRVGALYGDIPATSLHCKDKWGKVGRDFVCPVVSCVSCGGQMRWLEKDHAEKRERLVCASCNDVLDGSVFPLTRESMKESVPDILFTTTEMLNQRLSDTSVMHLFGVGPKAKCAPELVLLDEVHTYEGKHGAQVAYLMRRWQRVARKRLRFVGLSATLREAPQFFADLTGCHKSLVDEVSPRPDEIESEGAEYMVALRGDPVSRAALLSTTIQTAMVLQRCLDPKADSPGESVSRGLFGQRTFVFTDNLDVINRLYFDLLSAEGRNSFGDPDMRNAPDGGLALLRERRSSLLRYANGQDWRFCEELHKGLRKRLVVKRVSSQDRGVDSGADVIVATAVLEVGFDDPVVGAVIQHKAPRGTAGFLQRKGRGGRTRGMRPWTAVVLSDYGRDRAVYQNYDLLFDPELPVRTLPLANRYIVRMQAVYATIDYLAQRLQDGPSGSVWLDLSGGRLNANRRSALVREIRGILESEAGTKRLRDHLRRTLDLSDEEVSAIFWEFPRPLMTTVLPTALRRLVSDWSADGRPHEDYQVINSPLPDFIPASLFADLNLADVEIDLPEASDRSVLERPMMAVTSALREFAPGRVSRRYGVLYRTERHWICPFPEDDGRVILRDGAFSLDVDSIGHHVFLGDFLLRRGSEVVQIPVMRPVRLKPTQPPKQVKDSSNASLKWHSQIVASVDPLWLAAPIGSSLTDVVARIGAFTHAHHCPVEIRRFAVGAASEVSVGTEKIRAETEFKLGNEAVGLGESFSADAVLFQIKLPEALHLRQGSREAEKWRALRTSRYMDVAWRGGRLSKVNSPFMREWLAQIYISALTYEAMSSDVSLSEAAASIEQGRARLALSDVLTLLFQSKVVEAQGDDEAEGGPDKLRVELEECLRDSEVISELYRLGELLWSPIGSDWEPWLRGVYQSTLAAAFLKSIIDLCPSIDAGDLAVDLDRGPVFAGQDAGIDANFVEVWISERSPGGNGLVEEFMRRYAEDPRRFFATVRANLGLSEFEIIDAQLSKMVGLLAEDEGRGQYELAELVGAFRSAKRQDEMSEVFRRIKRTLASDGFSAFHGFVVALASRILRPGSGLATDLYLASALEQWHVEEKRIGIEIDLRVMSYYLSQSDEIDHVIADGSLPAAGERAAWRNGAIYGLLWSRGRSIRNASLPVRSPYSELPLVERLLVVDTVGDDRVLVSLTDEDWMATAFSHLSVGKAVTLSCMASERHRLAMALNQLVTNPVESGYLRVFARLQGVRLAQSTVEADIELIEAVQ